MPRWAVSPASSRASGFPAWRAQSGAKSPPRSRGTSVPPRRLQTWTCGRGAAGTGRDAGAPGGGARTTRGEPRTGRPIAQLEPDAPVPYSKEAAGGGVSRAASGAPRSRTPIAPLLETPAPTLDRVPVPRASAARASPPAPRANPFWAWFTGGNALTRIGVVIMFFGVAFLLKYFAEHFTVSIELRLAAVAGFASRADRARAAPCGSAPGATVFRCRAPVRASSISRSMPRSGSTACCPRRRRSCCWSVVAALTIGACRARRFAAARGVGDRRRIPRAGARRQRRRPFAAVRLLCRAERRDLRARLVQVLARAQRRGLRLHVRAGLGVGARVLRCRRITRSCSRSWRCSSFSMWGSRSSTCGARRRTTRDPVDGLLVFGVPLAGFALQAALVHEYRSRRRVERGRDRGVLCRSLRGDAQARGARISAPRPRVCCAGGHFCDGRDSVRVRRSLHGRDLGGRGGRRVLDRRAAERAASRAPSLSWSRSAPGILFAISASPDGGDSLFANAYFAGAMLIAAAGLVTACIADRAASVLGAGERALTPAVFGWGVLWWLAAGSVELVRHLPRAEEPHAVLAWVTASVALALVASRWLAWPRLAGAALVLLPAMAVVAYFDFELNRTTLEMYGWIVWPCAWIVHWRALCRGRADARRRDRREIRSGRHRASSWNRRTRFRRLR